MRFHALLLLVVFAGCAVQSAYRPNASSAREGTAFHPDSLSERLHAHINQVRAQHNAPPLTYFEPLEVVGALHSRDMDRRGYFSHVSPEGRTPADRMTSAGVECPSRDDGLPRHGLGENLYMLSRYSRMEIVESALGRTDTTYIWDTVDALAQAITQGWLDSPPHRENLLNPLFRAHGLGVVAGQRHMVYVTQMLC